MTHKGESIEQIDDQQQQQQYLCRPEQHLLSKAHKKIKQMYNLTSTDEQHCLMVFQPGEHQELKTERLNAFKDRCKKIK